MAANTVRAHIGVVVKNISEEYSGMIEVQLFATPNEESNSLWMPFLTHSDIHGYGFHSLPKVGDTVLVVGYGDTADTYVAMANFWAPGQSPFYPGTNKKYKISYPAVDSTKVEGIDETKLNDIGSIVKTIEKNPDKNTDFSKIRSISTLNYQLVLDETDSSKPVAIVSTRDGKSLIELSDKGINIYDSQSVNIFSEGNVSMISGGDTNIIAKEVSINGNEKVLINSANEIEIIGTENIQMDGKEINLNKKPDNNQAEDQAPGRDSEPFKIKDGNFGFRFEIEIPYVDENGNITNNTVFYSNQVNPNGKNMQSRGTFLFKENDTTGSQKHTPKMKFIKDLSSASFPNNIEEQFIDAYANNLYKSFIKQIDVACLTNIRNGENGEVLKDREFIFHINLVMPDHIYMVPAYTDKAEIYEDPNDVNGYVPFDSNDNFGGGGSAQTFFARACFRAKPRTYFLAQERKFATLLPVKIPNIKYNLLAKTNNDFVRVGSTIANTENIVHAYGQLKKMIPIEE